MIELAVSVSHENLSRGATSAKTTTRLGVENEMTGREGRHDDVGTAALNWSDITTVAFASLLLARTVNSERGRTAPASPTFVNFQMSPLSHVQSFS